MTQQQQVEAIVAKIDEQIAHCAAEYEINDKAENMKKAYYYTGRLDSLNQIKSLLQETGDGWVDVKDQLPEDGEMYFIYSEGTVLGLPMSYNSEIKEFERNDWFVPLNKVSMYHPYTIPSPPKAK